MDQEGRKVIRIAIPHEGHYVLGPGKADLLEAIQATGSISGAGRAMDMSYRRAWLLVDEMNRGFREPLVETRTGGRYGGGARVTPLGLRALADYRALQDKAWKAILPDLEAFRAHLAP